MRPPQRILIIRLSSLGDILHALPAFQSLRVAFPEAEIDWLVEERMKFVLAGVPGINNVLVVDTQALRRTPWSFAAWRQFWRLVSALRNRQYDVSLDFQGLVKTAILTRFSGARLRLGFSREVVRERPAHWFYNTAVAAPGQQGHVAHLNQELARAAGGKPAPLRFPLAPTESDLRAIDSRLEREKLSEYVIINPGAGWATKTWKAAKYGELAARIQKELNLDVIVTTGPGEERLFNELSLHCPAPQPRHFPVTFGQLIPLYKKARLLVGGDTGPFHLATLLGTPVVGIFGPTSPVRNGPISERDEVVVHVLPCSFCYGRTCPTQNECMDITVDEVFNAVVRRLEKEETIRICSRQ